MNQAILFPELEVWNKELQQVEFPAIVQGMRIQCCVGLDSLSAWANAPVSPENALLIFQQYRWDIEEGAEYAINQQQFDDEGYVHIE